MIPLALLIAAASAQETEAVETSESAEAVETTAQTEAAAEPDAPEAALDDDAEPAAGSGNPDWPYLSEVQSWWLEHGEEVVEGEGGLRERGAALGLPDDTTFLVHAPTGPLLAPAPSSLREAAPVQVVMLVPAWVEVDYALDPSSCAQPSRFDVEGGDLALALSTEGDMSALDLGAKADFDEPDRYRPSLVGQHFRCGAGSLAYSLQAAHPVSSEAGGVATATSAVEIAVRDTAHIAAVFAPGWDFGTRTEAWVDTSAASVETVTAEDGSETTLTYQGAVALDSGADAPMLGPGLYAGAMWMIGGVDYSDMRWYNYFANPFLAVGVSGLGGDEGGSDDAVQVGSPSYLAGTALTPTGGISLAIGASIRPELELRGLQAGDLLQDGASIQYRSTWSGARPSLFVGLAVDSRIYSALTEQLGLGA